MGDQVALRTVWIFLIGLIDGFKNDIEGFSSPHVNHQLPARPVDGFRHQLDIVVGQFEIATGGIDHQFDLADHQEIVSKTRLDGDGVQIVNALPSGNGEERHPGHTIDANRKSPFGCQSLIRTDKRNIVIGAGHRRIGIPYTGDSIFEHLFRGT